MEKGGSKEAKSKKKYILKTYYIDSNGCLATTFCTTRLINLMNTHEHEVEFLGNCTQEQDVRNLNKK